MVPSDAFIQIRQALPDWSVCSGTKRQGHTEIYLQPGYSRSSLVKAAYTDLFGRLRAPILIGLTKASADSVPNWLSKLLASLPIGPGCCQSHVTLDIRVLQLLCNVLSKQTVDPLKVQIFAEYLVKGRIQLHGESCCATTPCLGSYSLTDWAGCPQATTTTRREGITLAFVQDASGRHEPPSARFTLESHEDILSPRPVFRGLSRGISTYQPTISQHYGSVFSRWLLSSRVLAALLAASRSNVRRQL